VDVITADIGRSLAPDSLQVPKDSDSDDDDGDDGGLSNTPTNLCMALYCIHFT